MKQTKLLYFFVKSKILFSFLLIFCFAFISANLFAQENALGLIDLPNDYYQTMTYNQYQYGYTALPSTFDWNAQGMVTPAKDQGSCGSCWAFAAVGAFESKLLIAGYGSYDLSEQQQISCNTTQQGCAGGSLDALRYWENTGPKYESCTGYSATDGSCLSISSCLPLGYRTTGYYTVNTNIIEEIKTSIYIDGPGVFGFDVYSDFDTFWYTGSSEQVYQQSSGYWRGGHAVLIIGWDDVKGAWLCKNSWGSGGPNNNGRFWISYSGHRNSIILGMANSKIRRDITTISTDANYYTGDFNGDGKSDLLVFNKYDDGDSVIFGCYGTSTGLSGYATWASYASTSYHRDAANYYTGDFNGDGKADLMAFYKYSDGDSKIFGWYGTSTGLSPVTIWASYASTSYHRDAANYYTGDFNGDGKTDLMAFYKYSSTGASKIFGWYGTSTGLSAYTTWASYASTSYARDAANYYTGDFNGDGKTDLMAFYKYDDGHSKIFGWYGTSTGLSAYTTWASYASTIYARDAAKYYTGDFNGDGKIDLMAFYKYSDGDSKIFGWYGTSTGLSAYTTWASYTSTIYARDAAKYYTGDFNGDGKADLVAFYKYDDGDSKIFGWYGTSTGLSAYTTWASYASTSYTRYTPEYYTDDFSGDGKTDLMAIYNFRNSTINIIGWHGKESGIDDLASWFQFNVHL